MANENRAVSKVVQAIDVLDFNIGTFAYFMARQGEKTTARFFGVCIAFLNEIAKSREDAITQNEVQRAETAARMIDAMNR
jgi:hypothetical protein